MKQNIIELKEKILQKNLILNSIKRGDNSEFEKIRVMENELDGLVYQYYKQIKCN